MNLIPFYKDVVSWNNFAGNSIDNKSLIDLYENLVDEESKEVFDSIIDKDPVEFLDGIADSLVVGSFLQALVFNYNFENHVITKNNGDLSSLITELRNLVKQPKENILDIITTLEKISNSIDVDINKCCEEVMISNWSKFPKTDLVIPENEINHIESQGRYSGIVFEIKKDTNGIERYIFKNNKGKIVKPSTFKEPRLSQFVTEDLRNFFL